MSNSNTNLKHIIKSYKDTEPGQKIGGSPEGKTGIPAILNNSAEHKSKSQRPLGKQQHS